MFARLVGRSEDGGGPYCGDQGFDGFAMLVSVEGWHRRESGDHRWDKVGYELVSVLIGTVLGWKKQGETPKATYLQHHSDPVSINLFFALTSHRWTFSDGHR